MFVCVYSEMIFKDCQEAFQSKLKKSDLVIEDVTKFGNDSYEKSRAKGEEKLVHLSARDEHDIDFEEKDY